jgi:SAM-dependent methyltransferase
MTDDRVGPPLARVWNEGERHLPTADPESKNHYRHMTAYHFALPLVRDRDVLDYGCGSGYGANFLWRRGRPRSLVAVDVSPDAIAYCRAVYTDVADHFRLAAAGTVPAPEASVDIVLLFQTLEHAADDRALLRGLARALRPGGVLLITTPNVALSGGDADHPENVHHVREYERNSLLRLCHSVFAGVEEYGVRGSFRVGGGGLGPERILLYRAVRRIAQRLGHRPYVAPVSLADFAIDARRLEESLDLLFVCRQPSAP